MEQLNSDGVTDEECDVVIDMATSLIELTKRARMDQGMHEAEVTFGGECDLQKHLNDCTKNPGHEDFIPISDFTLDNLPSGYKDTLLLETIRAQADLTVRLIVKSTSPNRPKTYSDSDEPYPFHNFAGMKLMRVASGWMGYVVKYDRSEIQLADMDEDTADTEDESCPCVECQASASPRQVWWEIWLVSATHVVYDDYECKDTIIEFFYDKDSTRHKTLKLRGHRLWYGDMETDQCTMTCITHDPEVAEMLEDLWQRRGRLVSEVVCKYRRSEPGGLTVVVSHPHGCQKHVTVGKDSKREGIGSRHCVTYDTATCPGSSGGLVWPVGLEWDGRCRVVSHSEGLWNGNNRSGADWWLV